MRNQRWLLFGHIGQPTGIVFGETHLEESICKVSTKFLHWLRRRCDKGKNPRSDQWRRCDSVNWEGVREMADGGHICWRTGTKVTSAPLDHQGNCLKQVSKNIATYGIGGDAIMRKCMDRDQNHKCTARPSGELFKTSVEKFRLMVSEEMR